MSDIIITQYNKLIINYDTIEISPSNYKEISFDNAWYLNFEDAPDFIENNITAIEKNNLVNITVPDSDYSISDYHVKFVNCNFNIVVDTTDYESLLKNYLDTLDMYGTVNGGDSLSKINNHYYSFDSRKAQNWGGNRWSTWLDPNYTYDQIKTLIIPLVNYDSLKFTTHQEFPILTTFTVTYNSNLYSISVPEHTVYATVTDGPIENIIIPAGNYNWKQYNDYLNTLLSKLNISGFEIQYYACYDYPWNTIFIRENQCVVYGENTFNDLYCKLHFIKPETDVFTRGHNGPPVSRSLSMQSGVYTVDDLVNNININSSDTLFTCQSTNHEILLTADIPFILNPACSITGNNEANVTQTFENQKQILYHPQYQDVGIVAARFTDDPELPTGAGITGLYTPAELLLEINKEFNIKIDSNLNFPTNADVSINNFIYTQSGSQGYETVNICGIQKINYDRTVYYIVNNFSYPQSKYECITGITNINISCEYFGNYVSFSAINLPDGLSIDPVTGNITGVPTVSNSTSTIITCANKVSSKIFEIFFDVNYLYNENYVLNTRTIAIKPNYEIQNITFKLDNNYLSIDSSGTITGELPANKLQISVMYNNYTQTIDIYNLFKSFVINNIHHHIV